MSDASAADTSSGEVTPLRTPRAATPTLNGESLPLHGGPAEPEPITIVGAEGFSIVVVPPDTKSNFLDFNKPCDDLNSEFLMQPINEAEYDSETQACVDTRTGGPTSFYEHYVTKRRRKKGKKGCTIEGHHPRSSGDEHPTHHIAVKGSTKDSGGSGFGRSHHLAATAPSGASSRALGVPPPVVDLLSVPSTSVPKGSLSNVAVRRIACGRMPPTMMPPFQQLADGGAGDVPTGPSVSTADSRGAAMPLPPPYMSISGELSGEDE